MTVRELARRSPRSPCCLRTSGLTGLSMAIAAILLGCRPAPTEFPASLNSQRPEERVRAAKQAVDHPYASPEERRAVLEMLVWRLDDDDPAVRFFAILALERMTGTRLGYSYHARPDQRLRAVQAWRRYLRDGSENDPGKPSAHWDQTSKVSHGAEAIDMQADLAGDSP